MDARRISLRALNAGDQAQFRAAAAPLVEGAPAWVARAWAARPFVSGEALHRALCTALDAASRAEQIALIRAHPDLVGRAARAGTLGAQSAQEQAAAGLDRLTAAEIATFARLNTAYQAKFGFPFVICAREHKKAAILAAFPARLAHDRDTEIAAALAEIARIVRLRIADTVVEDGEG